MIFRMVLTWTSKVYTVKKKIVLTTDMYVFDYY